MKKQRNGENYPVWIHRTLALGGKYFHDSVSRRITSFRMDWTPLSKNDLKTKILAPRLKISKFWLNESRFLARLGSEMGLNGFVSKPERGLPTCRQQLSWIYSQYSSRETLHKGLKKRFIKKKCIFTIVFLGKSRHFKSIGPPFQKRFFQKMWPEENQSKRLLIFSQNVRIHSNNLRMLWEILYWERTAFAIDLKFGPSFHQVNHIKSVCYQFLLDGEFIRKSRGGNRPKKNFHHGFKCGLPTFKVTSLPHEYNFLKKEETM